MSERGLDAKYADFKHEYAKVNGVRLHYVTRGQGKLMLFAHGFPEFWYMWKDQLVEFGQDHQAVALDMRGYNLSSKPEGVAAYQMDLLIEDFRALAEHLGHRTFTLVSHDWGGVVAWSFAMRHPDWLKRLIVINAPHLGVFSRLLAGNPDQIAASQYIRMFRTPDAEKILSANGYVALLNAVQTEARRLSETDRAMYLEAWSQPGALTGGLNYYRASAFEPPAAGQPLDEARLRQVKAMDSAPFMVRVPTLVIWGERDTALTVHNLDGLERYVPDLSVRRGSDGSHRVVNEEPMMVNSLIRDFIRSRP